MKKQLLFAVVFLVSLLPVMAQKTRTVNKVLRSETMKVNRPAPSPTTFAVGTIKAMAEEPNSPLPFQFIFEENGNIHPLQGKNLARYVNKQVYLTGQQKDGLTYASSIQLVDPFAPTTTTEVRHIQFPDANLEMDYDAKDLFAQPDNTPFVRMSLKGMNYSSFNAPFLTIPPPTIGTEKVLAVLFNFAVTQQRPVSRADIMSIMFTGVTTNGYSAAQYFWDASGAGNGLSGRFTITGDVMDYITVPDDPTVNCSTNLYETITNHVMAQIPADVKAQYTRYIFFYPQQDGCPGPQAQVGIRGDKLTNQFAWIPVTSAEWSDFPSFFNYITHEFGHELGLQHAKALATTGQIYEVNDRSALMTDRIRYPNCYERLILGWFKGKLNVVNSPVTGNFNLISPGLYDRRGQKIILIPLYNSDGSFSGNVGCLETRKDLLNFYETFSFQYVPFTTGWAFRTFPADLSNMFTNGLLIDTTAEPVIPNLDNSAIQPGITYTNSTWGVMIHVSNMDQTGSLSGDVTSMRAH